jgi:hypothetical protein
MVDKLMGYCEVQHDYEAGLMYGALLLRYDPARERTHRRLMRLHYLAGDRTAALRQYERCVAALEEELSVKPARRTVMLYRRIRSDQVGEPVVGVLDSPLPGEKRTSLCSILDHLRQLESELDELQRQVHQDVQAMEQALSDHC